MTNATLESLLMQPEPTTGAHTSEPAGTAAHGGRPSGQPTSLGQQIQLFMPFVLMFLVFYFLLMRPQQKKQRAEEDMRKALRKGDIVRTSGGIRGEIIDIGEADVTLMIADKVKINVLRTHIAGKTETAAKDKA